MDKHTHAHLTLNFTPKELGRIDRLIKEFVLTNGTDVDLTDDCIWIQAKLTKALIDYQEAITPIYKEEIVNWFVDKLKLDYLLFSEAEFRRSRDKTERQFEDDGTLFYEKDNICIYEYFWQDNKITKQQEKGFYTLAKQAHAKICERLNEFLEFNRIYGTEKTA